MRAAVSRTANCTGSPARQLPIRLGKRHHPLHPDASRRGRGRPQMPPPPLSLRRTSRPPRSATA